jgi:hypothetical protein
VQKSFRNYDVEIPSILTVYVYISDDILANDGQGSVGRQGCRDPGVQWYVVGWSVIIIVPSSNVIQFLVSLHSRGEGSVL